VKHRTSIDLSAQHPAFAGHFPQFPVLPGAVLLDEALRIIERELALDLTQWKIASAKFLDVVRPGDTLRLEHEPATNGVIRFSIHAAERQVAGGTLANAL
jgi:3-hydroxyacyl-[acyl-carrier-protein] dehydratase